LSTVNSLITGAGSNSLALRLNFGLRGTVVVVVQPFAAGQRREDAQIGRRVSKFL
jgi:hypothetical protein